MRDFGKRWLLMVTMTMVAAAGGCEWIEQAVQGQGQSSGGGAGGAGGPVRDGGSAPAGCKIDSDCRLFADYCTGCDCRALGKGEADPTCSGPGVRCVADPCRSLVARCVEGRCIAGRAAAYSPCAGKTCGQACSLCPPDAVGCVETAVVKTCGADGKCTAGQSQCK